MMDYAKTICNNTDFVGIAKAAVNVELLYLRVGSNIGSHKSISGFIMVIMIVKVMGFCIGFELFNDEVSVFEVVFCDPGFDSGRIKNSHICFCRINRVANGFRKVNKLQVIEAILFKACEFRSIRDLILTAELTEVPGIVKENQKQGIRRDRKNPLDNKSP